MPTIAEARAGIRAGKTTKELLAEGHSGSAISRARKQLETDTPHDGRHENPGNPDQVTDPTLEGEEPTTEGDDPMAQQFVTEDQLTIRDQTATIARLEGELAQASQHSRLGSVLQHAGEACQDCQQDLNHYREGVIKKAFEDADPAILRQMLINKGLLPTTFTVTLP